MHVAELGFTVASATVHAGSDLIDIETVFGEEVQAAVAEAIAARYSDLNSMLNELHNIRLVRQHLAAARWEAEQDQHDFSRQLETLQYPLSFKPAPRRALND